MLSLVESKLPYFPISWLLRSPFRSDLDMPRITAPVLIVHGEMDTLVPIRSARQLAALAKTVLRFEAIQEAGHANGLLTPETIVTIDRFLGISIQ
jgi:pimeloyl-ACP methyl ester carboxylesterase